MLGAAKVIPAKPAVITDVHQQVSRPCAPARGWIHQVARHPTHGIFKADGWRNPHRTPVPRNLKAHRLPAPVKVKGHARRTNGKQRALQPIPIGDVRHGLAKRCQKDLVVARIGWRILIHQIRTVELLVPSKSIVLFSQADEYWATNQKRRADPFAERGGDLLESITRKPTVRFLQGNRFWLQTVSSQHGLRPRHQRDGLRALNAVARAAQCQLSESWNVTHLIAGCPSNLVARGKVGLNEQHARALLHWRLRKSPRSVQQCKPQEQQKEHGAWRHTQEANSANAIKLRARIIRYAGLGALTCPVTRIHHGTRTGKHQERAEDFADQVCALREYGEVNERMPPAKPRVAIKEHDCTKRFLGAERQRKQH